MSYELNNEQEGKQSRTYDVGLLAIAAIQKFRWIQHTCLNGKQACGRFDGQAELADIVRLTISKDLRDIELPESC